MNNFFDNQRILSLIWKRKIHFVIVGAIAIVLAAIFSGPAFITPKFKSTARIYPTNINTISEESETEQMLEILNSRDIKLKMFDAFDLSRVYEIDKELPQFYTFMFAEYDKNVNTSKTEYETVEIKVMDKDPVRAKNMCDSIIYFYNHKVGSMHKAKSWEMVEITQDQLNLKQERYETYRKQLDTVRNKYGLFDLEGQSPEITRGYMNALATGRGNTSDAKKIERLYDNFMQKGTEIAWVEKQTRSAMSALDSLTKLYDLHLMEFNKDITYSHVVEHAMVADKKSFPVRWLIVAFSAFSAVFMALLVFLVLDYRKEDGR